MDGAYRSEVKSTSKHCSDCLFLKSVGYYRITGRLTVANPKIIQIAYSISVETVEAEDELFGLDAEGNMWRREWSSTEGNHWVLYIAHDKERTYK